MLILLQGGEDFSFWLKLIAGGGLLTFITAMITLWVTRNKTKGEGAEAIEKGAQAALHTSEIKSQLELTLEQNAVKRKTLSIETLDEFVANAYEQSDKINLLLAQNVQDKQTISKQEILINQQLEMLNRKEGIINAQWERYELALTKLVAEQRDHDGCLKKVESLEKQLGEQNERIDRLSARIKELEPI